MPKVRNKTALTIAATVLGLVALPVAQASANCANYAKLSLQQQQENTRNNCGNTGPEWSADMRQLLAWCSSKSPQDAQEMLSKRKEALSSCKAQ